MRTLLFLALLAVTGWYGWNHRDTLFGNRPGHEAVIENDTSFSMERVRLTVNGQTMVKESIPPNGKAAFRFAVDNDSEFVLVWQRSDAPGDRHWRGGRVAKGPLLQRHVFRIDRGGQVMYYAETKDPTAPN